MPDPDNKALIERFYEAFARRDADAMVACYHDDIRFSDPVFPDLEGARAGNMWRMLCGRASDLKVEASAIEADETTARAHWEAWYTFSATGRKVHNVVEARFRLRDGKIVEHRDSFPLWKWTRMALGPSGVLLGWTPLVRNKLRARAAAGLDEFEQQR
jgi:ketosteroid isomerase-like protein